VLQRLFCQYRRILEKIINPMEIGKLAKRTGITILVAGLLVLALHLLVKWRTHQILDFIVKEASGGTYEATTSKVKIHYYPLRLEASKIFLRPVDSTGKDYYAATADSFFLEIGHVWSLIRRKNFTIRKVVINNLQVQVLTSARMQRDRLFHQALGDIQNAIVNSLTALKVEECKIRDAGISYARRDQSEFPLLINHINLDIDNLVAERVINPYETKASITANVRLLIDKPTVQLPDTSVHIGVDNLWLNTRENKFTVNRFRILYSNNSGTQDSILLSNINLQQFNWERYLEKGVMEIGTLQANNGTASFDFSDRKLSEITRRKDTADRKKIHLPINIHKIDINKIEYSVKTKLAQELINVQLDGDSLSIDNVYFNSDSAQPLKLEKLAFKVSNYINKRDNRQNSSRFDRLLITHNKLELQNFYRELDGEKFGTNNSIFIPVLRVEDFSLPMLLEAHSLHARKLFLEKPTLVIDIKKSNKKQDADQTITRIMDSLRSSLDISAISIKDATITLIPKEKTSGIIVIENLSTEIDAKKLLAATSIMEMIESATALSTSGFKLSSDHVHLDIQRSSLTAGFDGIFLERVKGDIGNKFNIDLFGINITDKSRRFDVTKLQSIHLDRVSVDSGQITIMADKKATKKEGAMPPPVIILDELVMGNTHLRINHQQNHFDIRKANLQGTNISFNAGVGSWSTLELRSGEANWVTPKYAIRSSSLKIDQPGTIQARNTRYLPVGNEPIKKLEIPLLTIKTDIPGTLIKEKKAEYVTIEHPVIDVEIGPSVNGEARAISIPDIALEKLTIKDPHLNVWMPGAKKPIHFSSDTGLIVLNAILGRKLSNKLTVQKMDMRLASPIINIDSSIWTPSDLHLKSHDISFEASPRKVLAFVDTMQVLGMPVSFQKNGVEIKNARAGIANFKYRSTDSISLSSIIKTGNWWAGAASIEQLGKYSSVHAYNPLVSSQPQTITIDSFHLQPLLPRQAFWEQFPFEKAFLDIKTGPIKFYDYSLVGEGKDRFFSSKFMDVADVHLYVAKDRTRGPDSIKYRPLLAGMLQQIPLLFNVDSIQIINGYVKSDVISIKTKNEGVIYFSNINGPVTKLKNHQIAPADTLAFRLQSRINGEGDMLVAFRQSYLDSNQSFKLEAKMGRLDMRSLNSILLPLGSMQIDRGVAEEMSMSANGNDVDAIGYMDMRYRDLKVSWHRKGASQFFLSRFFNWAINAIINTNSKQKSKLLYAKRHQEMAIFNFWGRLAIQGLLINTGIRVPKKELRKYRKAVKEGKAEDFKEIL
jgi:hypothetical protein